MRRRWEDIDPTKHEEANETGLDLEAGAFISPFDVPDGVRLDFTGPKGYEITLRYLTDQEEIVLGIRSRPESSSP